MSISVTATGQRRRREARVQAKRPYDPTKIRMSKYFMLSDFMGCYSVYSRGLSNQIYTTDDHKIQRGYVLAETLDLLEEELGVISVAYGFISPSLSNMIVTYQDPNKPSFHRWELGAACDIQFMEADYSNAGAPAIEQACNILKVLDGMDYARMITYAESPWICFATSLDRKENTRRLYENRYWSNSKPTHHKWTKQEATLIAQVERREHPVYTVNGGNWAGAGYPTHHSHKIQQLHHIKLADTVNLSDLLYSKIAVHHGLVNAPHSHINVIDNLRNAANVLSHIHGETGHRVSVVSAYENPITHGNTGKDYEHGFCFDIVLPEHEYTSAEAIDVVTAAIRCSDFPYSTATWHRESSDSIQRITIRG